MRFLSVLLGVGLCACGVEPSRPAQVHTHQQALRPTDTASNLMWRYQPGDTVTSIAADGGSFRVHYTEAGINAVPSQAFVEDVDATYEAVGALYHGALGYRHPLGDGAIADNGGDDRFDVYLLNFSQGADGSFRVDQCPTVDQCLGYVVQENDFVGFGYPSVSEATRILGSHEYFHAVQAAYDANQNAVISEGTAVWATERFDPASNDFEGFVGGYLAQPDRSLDNPPTGPVPDFAYGAAIFFKFLSERFDDQLIRTLWEHLENGHGAASEPADQADPTFLVQLDAVLREGYQSSFAEAFTEFARWNLYTGSANDPTLAWADATHFPAVASTATTLPFESAVLRVYYASAQYFTAPAGTHTLVTGALVDSSATATDDREDLTLWLAVKQRGRITDVKRITSGETVDVTDAQLVAVVVNGRRGATGTSLSQRPILCLGAVDEVNACAGLTPPDAGQPDAGQPEPDAGIIVDAGVDAGAPSDAGMTPTPSPTGCGCGMSPAPLSLLLLLFTVLRRRPAR